jgi:hypothetical protein
VQQTPSVASYFKCFSTIMTAAVMAKVVPADPCSGIRVTNVEWEPEKYVATPLQILRASMRLYENESQGVPIEDIAALAGHVSTVVTEKVYRHEPRPAPNRDEEDR